MGKNSQFTAQNFDCRSRLEQIVFAEQLKHGLLIGGHKRMAKGQPVVVKTKCLAQSL